MSRPRGLDVAPLLAPICHRPAVDDSLERLNMLRGLAPAIAKHHGVTLLDEAVRAAVHLSHRYIPARQLPDKAISLLDTACARVAMSLHAPSRELLALQARRDALQSEHALLLQEVIRTQTRRPSAVPAYEHRDPCTTFKTLVEDTRELLNNLLVRSAQNIELKPRPHGMHLASLDPMELRGFGSLVLAVTAHLPAEQLAQQFPAHSKLAPADRLPELVRLHLPGIALRVLPVPPRQIPFNAGYVYFQVEPQGEMWEHMLTHGGIGLHLANRFAGLRMELWGVR